MAGNPKSQIWLTSALTDADVPKALTLCLSLRRVLTTRKIGVIVSRNLPEFLKESLYHGFDFFFYLEQEHNKTGLDEKDFVKLFVLRLKPFEKCVFLNPTMVAIKNCDEIFDKYDAPLGTICGKVVNSPMFVVRPCPKTFKDLMTTICMRNGARANIEEVLEQWNASSQKIYVGKMLLDNDKYNTFLSTSSGTINMNQKDMAIIDVADDLTFDDNTDGLGFFSKMILDYRKQLHNKTVQWLCNFKQNGFDELFNSTFHKTEDNEVIAIIGMSCRYPSANNLEEFWDLLLNGKDGTGTPPEYRWLRNLSIKDQSEHRGTNAGFLHYPVEEFDAKFFGISPLEMEYLDPQTRLLHELIWEGLEDAAVNPQRLRGTNGGVFTGSWTNDYKDILTLSGDDDFYRKYSGNSIGSAAARISFLLGMTGPSIATESGCSSAMIAVHLACKSLQLRETNFALACGVNLLLHPFNQDYMPSVLSTVGLCKTFDESADGFSRAEGCGVLVLKRLSDAVRDGDKIWALIKGTGMAQEGLSKSMGTPTVHSESLAMQMALADANVRPEQVSYVETHGTGTPVGDPMEVAAIAKAYHSNQRKEPLLIGSVKTNVGHTESCSGITGIMKVVLSMQHEIIPPHRNFKNLNPAINLEAIPARIPLEPVEWYREGGKPRYAGVSSFGITGTDSHAIIQEPPSLFERVLETTCLERPLHVMKITAKTEDALDILVERYKSHLQIDDVSDFGDMAFTANVGRADFNHRAVVIAASKQAAVHNIETKKFMRAEASSDVFEKLCFLFTGQGSQYPGMAKQLYETSPVFRMNFEYCDNILKESYNIDITKVLWSSNDNLQEASRTIYSQTSIFCVEYALLKLWESWGVKPNYALGHSLGEFAAAVCAGLLTAEDAIKLVAERSRLIDNLPQGKMLVIKAEKKQVDALMSKFAGRDKTKVLDYAAINSPEQTVVAGDSEVVLQFSESCKQAGLKCIVLDATHAFHSKHMDPILNDYRDVAKSVKKLEGNGCKYISGMRGNLLESDEFDAEYWVQHTREKVLFMDASKISVELGCKTFIEIGPQPVLSALTMMNNDAQLLCLPSLKKNENEWETLLDSLGKLYLNGVDIDWEGFDGFYKRNKVRFPHYPFIGKRYWPDLSVNSNITIHPLLGSVIPNASPSKLFQSSFSLKNLDWVKDHVIGSHLIFPGAGYIEMCLAAGLATINSSTDSLSSPTRPMKLENLCIEAPLALQDATSSQQVQTVAELNENPGEENDITIKICRRVDLGSESLDNSWRCHAKATFSPLVATEDKNVPKFSVSTFLEVINQPFDEGPTVMTQRYEKLAAAGLKFGPNFKSIHSFRRDRKEGTLVAKLKLEPDHQHSPSQSKYVIHPVILDAMLQAIAVLGLDLITWSKKTFYVPIKIGKFVWLSGIDSSSQLYVYAFNQKTNSLGNGSALLVDSNGKKLALVSSLELIETTVKVVDAVLEAQTSCLPQFWEEVWKPTPSLSQDITDLECGAGKFFTENFHSEFEQKFNNNPNADIVETYQRLEKLIYLNFLRGLYELGWKPEEHLNKVFSESFLFNEFGIITTFRQYFSFMCNVLKEEGILEDIKGEEEKPVWKIKKIPPSYKFVLDSLASSELSTDLSRRYQPTGLLSKVGESLKNVLTGSVTSISILFPEDTNRVPVSYPSIADFYYHTEQVFLLTKLRVMVQLMLTHIRDSQPNPDFVLRILEIGGGTGSFTKKFLEQLESLGIRFEYTYTDISTSFFPAAQARFESHINSMKFSRLNIEEDPLEQGFIPDYFDLVIAAEVIHATRDIAQTLRNIHILMKPWGRLTIEETTRVDRLITFLFGTLDGYWRFQDKELRPNHCTLDKQRWTQVLLTCDFEVEGIFSVFNNFHSFILALKKPQAPVLNKIHYARNKIWLLFHKTHDVISTHLSNKLGMLEGRTLITIANGGSFQADEVNNRFTLRKREYQDFVTLFNKLSIHFIEGIVYCWCLDDTTSSQEEVLQPYFNLTKSLLALNLKVTPRFVLITRGAVPFSQGDNELSYIQGSTLWGFTKSLKNEYFNLNCRAIEIADEIMNEGRLQNIFYEIWSSDKESQVAFSGDSRYVPRFEALKPKITELKLPSGSTRFQLILPESKSISDLQFGPLDPIVLADEQVEVQIKASALNFRDVLTVIKPSEQFKNMNAVGYDFAGVVQRVGKNVTKWKIGDRVFGANVNICIAFPSHVQLHEKMLISLPHTMTFCDGATIPAVYITSIFCLLEVAKIRRNDVVLIHTASGGVGLSAIQVCKYVGCTIIATAGSKRKHNYLKSLGIEHIFHSRNTQYGAQILELTKGRGVDVVLNSLTSDGFKEATLKACATGARFVEMSKLNIWTKEEVRELRADVDYTIVDVSCFDVDETIRLLSCLEQHLLKNFVKPIPYIRFDGQNIREALQYLQKAKHVGKIVCAMPEMRNVGGEFKMQSPMFSSNATYLITGGLGGIGFVICQWMVEKGAKHVILAGRNPPSTSIENRIRDMNLEGSQIVAVQLDVGNFEDCKKLIQVTMVEMGLPPLRGVMHAAGTLANATLVDLDWEKLSFTFPPKINGTMTLHELTKQMNLEHFVLFSSMASLFGSPGQYNHAAANAFEDAFAHYRNSIGLPATTINWGMWGQVGVAKDLDLPGVKAISNLQALAGLEYVMKTQQLQVSINNIESFALVSNLVPQLSVYLDDRVWKASLKETSSAVIKTNEFWQLYDNMGENTEEKFELLRVQLQITLRNTLRLDERDVIKDDANFQEMGVDSLMFVEIKNFIQTLVGERLVINDSSIKDCRTVKSLAETLYKLIEGKEAENSKPTFEQVNQLIKQDCYLPELISAKECPPIGGIGDVKTVLLTGCTGNLGPYILKKLTQLPQIKSVICLMRPRKTNSLESYLLKILQENEISVDMSKIRLVEGNIAQAHLGLEEAMWEELSVDVDAIFHCAACVQHTEHYVARNSTTDARAVNIGGMKNLLEFACTTKLKYVYHSSSLAAVFTLDDDGRLSECWPEEGEYDGITTHAYPISKYVCDMLIKQAVERGIPCKAFRFPLIVGESTTGRCSLERNHLLLRYIFIMKNEVMPSTPMLLPMLPVDICADVSVNLFFQEYNEVFSEIYNVSHGEADADQEFVNVAAKFGRNVEIVEYSEFVSRIQESGDDKEASSLALFEEFYEEDAITRMYQSAPSLRTWLEGGDDSKNIWLSRKIPNAIPTFYKIQKRTMDYVYKDLCYCKSQGWFEKYGF